MMARPAVYIAPAVFAQAWKDAFAFACSRGLDKAKFAARRARAERGDLLDDDDDDDAPPAPKAIVDKRGMQLNVTPFVMGQQIAAERERDAHAMRAWVVTCGAHSYAIDAPDRNEAVKAARKQHAAAGLPSGGTAWRVAAAA